MVKNLLLLLSIMIIIISYTKIILIYLTTKNKRIENLTGFDLAKEITSNYDEINIVESKEITISKYNLKRRVIRLTPKNYQSNDIFTISLSACLSGYSLANINKDKYLKMLSNILPNIDYLNKSSILVILISLFTNTIKDAKIGILILGLILIYQYFLIQINTASHQYTKDSLKKIISKKELLEIEKILNSFLSIHKNSFIITLILILREVFMILNI